MVDMPPLTDDRQTDDRQTDRQTDRQKIGTQTDDRHADRQTDRQTGRHSSFWYTSEQECAIPDDIVLLF